MISLALVLLPMNQAGNQLSETVIKLICKRANEQVGIFCS